MPIVERHQSALIVIDTQHGFVDNTAMEQADRAIASDTVERIAWLGWVAMQLGVPTVLVEEGPNEHGTTDERIRRRLDPSVPVVEKTTFAVTGSGAAMAAIEETNRRTAVLVGFETDGCVAQSAVGLIDLGYRVVVPIDTTYSTCDQEHRRGLRRISDAGSELSSCKGLTLEWLETVAAASELAISAKTEFGRLPWRPRGGSAPR
jgi:nicotinamidase-related amidase